MCPDFRLSRSWCAVKRVALLAIGSLLFASPVLAQTAAGGAIHTIILKPDGTVWTVGGNGNGQLGDNTTTTKKTPSQVSGLSSIVAVAAGAQELVFLCCKRSLSTHGPDWAVHLATALRAGRSYCCRSCRDLHRSDPSGPGDRRSNRRCYL